MKKKTTISHDLHIFIITEKFYCVNDNFSVSILLIFANFFCSSYNFINCSVAVTSRLIAAPNLS